MSESRREVFRTSVITALGVAAGAVAGYEIAETSMSHPLTPPAEGSVVAVQDNKSGSWYLFYFGKANQCQLYGLTCVPTISTTTNINTSTWFQVAKKTHITKGPQTIWYLDAGGNQKQLALTFSAGYLDPGSYDAVSAVLPPAHLTPGSWNEIGHN